MRESELADGMRRVLREQRGALLRPGQRREKKMRALHRVPALLSEGEGDAHPRGGRCWSSWAGKSRALRQEMGSGIKERISRRVKGVVRGQGRGSG